MIKLVKEHGWSEVAVVKGIGKKEMNGEMIDPEIPKLKPAD